MEERIVVTGIGAVSPLGHSANETWQNALNGVATTRTIERFDTSNLGVHIACEVRDFNPDDYMPAKEARRRDRFEQFSTVVASEAIQHSGLDVTRLDPGRVGVIVSSSVGGLESLQDGVRTFDSIGPRKISPFIIPMIMPNGAAGLISIDYGFNGPALTIASACASGADGIGIAWMLLRSGIIDVAIAGASDAVVTPIGIAAFDRAGALSRRNEDFSMVPQPFDKNRDGLVMGEGAAILVLERESQARARGADIIAEIAGYASNADGFHITAPREDGSVGAEAMRMAMENARVRPDEVSYVNAHGTGTVLNDVTETRAIKSALGDSAYNIPVSSTKSMTGHMMGATGALEAMFCALAARYDVVPPTIHYQTPDPECDLDYVPNTARSLPVNVAVSNAFGFGGHNAVLVIRKFQ